MTQNLPVLDPIYETRPMDWSFTRIQEIARKEKPSEIVRPDYWKNPYAKYLAPRDQADRGTCVGQSTAYCYDMLYMALMKDIPTDADKATYKKNVIDVLGTLHDILYPQSASAEAFYQISRKIGNVTYPSGSEIRFSARAWKDYGMNLESQWHTDKTGHMVWMYPPGARATSDGGLSPTDAATFASMHKSEGYAQVGTWGGNCTWDQVCDAIYTKGFVLGAIPIYENYATMAGGNGDFPNPSGELAGFHALAFYGYDSDTLYLIHSWGSWCGQYGSISKEFFNTAVDLIQFFVILDSADVAIARGHYHSLDIMTKDSKTNTDISADIYINGVKTGVAPQRVACEPGKEYTIEAKLAGYTDKKTVYTGYDSDQSITLLLDPDGNVPTPPKNWFEIIIAWILSLFGIK